MRAPSPLGCITGVIALLITLTLVTLAVANDTSLNLNVNPPRQLVGDEVVPVRMSSERITVHLGREDSEVEVEFTFENLSDDYVGFAVGFPDEDLLARYLLLTPGAEERFGYLDQFGDVSIADPDSESSVLKDFEAWTRPAGAPESAITPLATELVKIERIAYEPLALASLGAMQWQPDDGSMANKLMFCHQFTLALEARASIVVGHRYRTHNGGNVEGQDLLSYTLGTGRTWAGTIGRAQIDVYFTEGWTPADLHFHQGVEDYAVRTNPSEAEWTQLAPDHIQAVWTDFDPSGERAYIMLATNPVPYVAE